MSCEHLHDAIVDVARGRDVGPGTVAAVDTHVEHCSSCRARFAREQTLSDGLRALAQSTRSECASAGVEAGLLAAFTEYQTRNRLDLRPKRFGGLLTRRFGLAEALAKAGAVALLAASGVAWWLLAPGTRVEEVRTVSTAPSMPREVKAPPSPAPEIRASHVAVTPPVAREGSRRRAAGTGRPPTSRVSQPEGFVALPSAAGLPAFESGEIVRVEVPVTSLPMYGIDIAPDARGPAVEADFLVGQDGQARAIRLVRNGRL